MESKQLCLADRDARTSTTRLNTGISRAVNSSMQQRCCARGDRVKSKPSRSFSELKLGNLIAVLSLC